MKGRVVAAALSAIAVMAAPALPARAATPPLKPCGATSGLLCTDIEVPLDRGGVVPGAVPLHVQELRARGAPRGTMFLIAGGPGQASTDAFDLGVPDGAAYHRSLFPGYTLVAFDNRGTGFSGPVVCHALQETPFTTLGRRTIFAGQCGAALGAAAPFYSTRDHAEDVEAVRQALGLGKIALHGVSYGSKLALAYALAHPDAVDRLVLDSVLPPSLPDPYEGNVVRAMPATLARYCPGSTCAAAATNFAAEFVELANRLERQPLRGLVLQGSGKRLPRSMTGPDLISLAISIDINPGLAAELPAAVHEALQGQPAELLRLFDIGARLPIDPAYFNYGLYAATTCADGLFPWDPPTPVDQRPPLLEAAIAGLPPGTFGPFGSWAAAIGSAAFCLAWPSPAGHVPLAPGPYPDVPVLAIAGDLDLRTPIESAVQVVEQFPRGHLLVSHGNGHGVLTSDLTGCAQRAVRRWLETGPQPPSACRRPRAGIVVPVPAVPRSFRTLPGKTKAESRRRGQAHAPGSRSGMADAAPARLEWPDRRGLRRQACRWRDRFRSRRLRQDSRGQGEGRADCRLLAVPAHGERRAHRERRRQRCAHRQALGVQRHACRPAARDPPVAANVRV